MENKDKASEYLESEELGADELIGEGEGDGQAETKKATQTKEERAKQAEARRRREEDERKAKERKIADDAYLKGQLESTKVNPFTNDEVRDEYDLKVLKVQNQIKEDGGDPINDLPKRLAEIDRKEATRKKEEAEKKAKSDKSVSDDIADFRSKNPNVDVRGLIQDAAFERFSKGRLGGEPLDDIYRDFIEFKEAIGGKGEGAAKKPASPSPNGGRKQEQTPYSKMTREQKEAELRKRGLIR